MAIPIQLRRNGTAASTPSSLLHGEVALNYADGKIFWKDASNVIQSFTFQSYALSSHTHAASDITSGTLEAGRLPLATTGAAGAVIVGTGLGVSSGTVSVTYGTIAGTACQGNDSRLSDTRTPTDNTVSTVKLQNDAVTYAKIQNVSATDRLLGRSSAGAGDVEEITCTAFGRSLIDDADAAAARTTLGVQPTASPAFTGAATFANTGNVVPLTVTNTGTANSFVVNDASGDTSPFVIDASGNVVCGSSTAKARLQTSGASAASPSLGSVTGSFLVTNSDTGYGMHFGVESSGVGWIQQGRTDGTATAYNLQLQPAGGQVLVPAGSASAPGVAISGDPDTGIAQLSAAGANTLSICTNSAERVRFGSGGRVAFYANSEKFGVQLNKTSVADGPYIGSDGADIFTISASDGAERVRVDANGSVGVGINAPTINTNGTVIHVHNSTASRAAIMHCTNAESGGAATNGLIVGKWSDNDNYFWEYGSKPIIFGTSGTEKMRIASDGVVTMNDVYEDTVGATNRDLFIDNTGKLGYVSSIRASKTSIDAIDDVTWLRDLTPVSFHYRKRNEDGTYTDDPDGTLDYGLIAEDVEPVAPELCFYDVVDGEPQLRGVHYSKLITPMLRYIQQLEKRIAALEERLNHA